MKIWLGFNFLTCFWLLVACGGKTKPSTPIQVQDAWVRAASQMDMGQDQGDMSGMGGSTSAAYMLIRNNGKEPDRLLKVDTPAAQSAEIHESKETDGVMSMRPLESVEVPAGGSVEFKPGGLHVMLVGLTRDLKAGEKVNLVLSFEKAGEVQVEADVRSP
jgi:periplasmic copper chaperone A